MSAVGTKNWNGNRKRRNWNNETCVQAVMKGKTAWSVFELGLGALSNVIIYLQDLPASSNWIRKDYLPVEAYRTTTLQTTLKPIAVEQNTVRVEAILKFLMTNKGINCLTSVQKPTEAHTSATMGYKSNFWYMQNCSQIHYLSLATRKPKQIMLQRQ